MAGVNRSTIQRIWDAHGLQAHRVTTFKLSKDPAFVEKLTDVVELYTEPAGQGRSAVRGRSAPCATGGRNEVSIRSTTTTGGTGRQFRRPAPTMYTCARP